MNRRTLLVSLASAATLAGCQGRGPRDCEVSFRDDHDDPLLTGIEWGPLGAESRLTMSFDAPTGTNENPTDGLLVFANSGELLGESDVPAGQTEYRWHVEGTELNDGVVRALGPDGRYLETRTLRMRCR